MDITDLKHPGSSLRSRIVTLDERGLEMHIIEAVPDAASDPVSLPLILLLHGFPELAYSWRKVIGPLSTADPGYHVVAPDLRGFGRTVSGARIEYDDPIAPFHALNIVEDVCALVKALGHDTVALLVGHDFGSIVVGHCVTAHPDLFRSVVFMSAPFSGVQSPHDSSLPSLAQAVSAALAALDPPRRHYTAYFCTRDANADLLGHGDLDRFLGGYYHIKSGAWPGNSTHPLPSSSPSSPTPPSISALAHDLTSLPEYYIMPAHESMPHIIARHAASSSDPAQFTWPHSEEAPSVGRVYAAEFARTGFQGGLNYYRAALSPPPADRVESLIALAGRQIHVPAAFISGARDWGVYQTPGALDRMRLRFGMQSEDVVLIEGAGHWVQQEAPDRVIVALLDFLDRVRARAT